MSRRINTAGLALIKRFEGLKLHAYVCPAGVPTIGYGHTRSVTMQDVVNSRTITEAEAERLLREDLGTFEAAVGALVKVILNDNQFAALVAFTFNVGVGAFRNSTLLKKINAREFSEVRAQLARWNKAGGKVLPGLTKRRAAEADLFERV